MVRGLTIIIPRPQLNYIQNTPQNTMTITTNRSCVLLKALTVEIRDVPIPPVSDGDVLVKVEATGICGSDVRARSPNLPYIHICQHHF